MTKPTSRPHEHDPGPEGAGAGPRVDMSPGAIDRRLRDLAQLHRLGTSLRTGRWLGAVHDGEGQGAGT